MTLDVWLAIFMWIFWAGIAAQFVLAMKAYFLEVREGMRISSVRLGITAGMLLIASTLVVSTMLMPYQPEGLSVQLAPQKAANPQVEHWRREIAQIDAQLVPFDAEQKALNERRQPLLDRKANIDNQIKAISPVAPAATPMQRVRGVNPQTRSIMVIAILALLFTCGLTGLVFGGKLQVLFPEGWSMNRSPEGEETKLLGQMDELADLVWSESYRDALKKAETIAEKKLKSLDQLDFQFLRGYAALQVAAFPKPEDDSSLRKKRYSQAVQDLEAVVAELPKRLEAVYTLGVAYGLNSQYEDAQRMFEQARGLAKAEDKLPFDHNESVCYLCLAEASLGANDPQKADAYFALVGKLGVLADSVAQTRLKIGMMNVRSAMGNQDSSIVPAALQNILSLPDLKKEEKAQVDLTCSALNARMALRGDNPQLALDEASTFLGKYLPTGLPSPTDDAADESFPAVMDEDLPFAREVFQGFLFIQAVALSRLESKRRNPLTEVQIARLAEPLLRGLQFVPRHRDLLGALGGFYYWFRREKRDEARAWMEASVAMGAHGRIVRTVLERDRLIELERREALDWFRSTSSRFLRDPALSAEVRRALVEELGRFQEFEPMLISLREMAEPDQEEPTIHGLRDRVRYLTEMLENIVQSGQPERFARLATIQNEYAACLAHVEQVSQTISVLERRAFAELAESLILR